MNVLIFVMTMLMLLALMTYSRLDAFRSSQVFQSIFKHYMEIDERGYFNVKAMPFYEDIKVKTKAGKTGGKAEGSPRVSVSLLLDKTQRESKSKEWLQTKHLLKNLISTLYDDQPFYKKAIEKRPSLPDDLMNAMTQAIDELPKEKRLKTAADLANLKLVDPELDQILYKILQGAAYKEIIPTKEKTPLLQPTKESVESEVDRSQADEGLESETGEFKSIEGYYSLLDFITASPTSKVRVFLAPKEVLESIFPNQQIVDSIISDRKQLYRQAINGAETKDLEATFKNQYERYRDPTISDESLSFAISKTNPKNYE